MLSLNGFLRCAHLPARAFFRTVSIFCCGGLLLSACSNAATNDSLATGGGDMGGNGDGNIETTLMFEPASILTLQPNQLAELRVRVQPSARQNVSFDLLTDAEIFDGFLLEATATVQSDGTAVVTIQAPSKTSTFAVRAKLDQAETRLAVAVSAKGFGTLMVRPSYSGRREIKRWTASARADMTCEQLTNYWQDGTLTASGSSVVQLDYVPSGVPIAVSLRGDEVVSGCTNLTNIKADEILDLSVQVNDRALGISGSELLFSLGIDASTTVFAQHLDAAIQLGLTTWRADSTTDRAALFEAIQAQIPANALATFQTNATTYQFESLIGADWEKETLLSDTLGQILTAATERIPSSTTFQGRLALSGNDSTFELLTAAGVAAESAGFVSESTWSVSAESTATLILGGVLEYRPLSWLTALAELEKEPGPQALLVEKGNCDFIASEWQNASGQDAYPGCDLDCVALHCSEAMNAMWDKVSMAGDFAALHIGVTGEAETQGSAEVSALKGTWIGRFDDGETSLKGPAVGTQLP